MKRDLSLVLQAAVAVVLAGCDGAVNTATTPTVPATVPLPGTVPPTLEEICADFPNLLPHLTLVEPADHLVVRKVSDFSPTEDVMSWGQACSTATDEPACQAELAALEPTFSGWGYCGEGCSDSGLLGTTGDAVWMADSPQEVIDILSFEGVADALFVGVASEYTPVCESARVEADGTVWFDGDFLVSDCPWTTEMRRVTVATDGALVVQDVLSVDATDACAGRRPEGLKLGFPCADPVGARLVALARLEAAAVVAFERLAVDLERFGAPTELVSQARRAADDEVRHAEQMTALAAARGLQVPPIEIEPHRERSLLAVALENATEGCARETFGVADALFRAHRAPTAELRALFAGIAADETRHAELSWAIDAWVRSVLPDASALLDEARESAWGELAVSVRHSDRDLDDGLGAPDVAATLQLVEEVRRRVA